LGTLYLWVPTLCIFLPYASYAPEDIVYVFRLTFLYVYKITRVMAADTVTIHTALLF
jgi:hypothetical protein